MLPLALAPDRVLMIDDDPVVRQLLPLLLNAEGYSVTAAESGEAALKRLATTAHGDLPAVVLVDLKMPGLGAAALAMRLRGAGSETTALIAMSATAAAPDEVACFDAFLRKPFTAADFAATLAGVRGHDDAAEPALEHGTPAPVLDLTNFAKLATIIGAEALRQVYKLFLEDLPIRIDRMCSAAEVRDEAAFTREAHAIKGSCGMLGATELQALAERAEAGGLATSSMLRDFQLAVERVRSILEMRLKF